MRTGVIGGTFDPMHYGHLVAGEEVRAALSLDKVLFVPAGEPPHKPGAVVSAAVHRVAMVELAIANNPHFALSLVDVERPGPSYSVDTLRFLRSTTRATDEIYFIVGVDTLREIPTWRSPDILLTLCRIVAVSRPGFAFDPHALDTVLAEADKVLQFVPVPELDISSTDLRRRVAEGLPIKYQVPEAVEEYIYSHRLYIRQPLAADRGGSH